MLFLDLDDFKDVNDTMGHDTGDRLLQTVADRIRAVCRAMDTPARRGGDEIALLPEGSVSAKALTLLAERLLEAIRAPLTLNRVQLIPGASAVGIALRGGGATTEELLREADVAIYHAKRAGKRNVVMFRSEMDGPFGLDARVTQQGAAFRSSHAGAEATVTIERRGVGSPVTSSCESCSMSYRLAGCSDERCDQRMGLTCGRAGLRNKERRQEEWVAGQLKNPHLPMLSNAAHDKSPVLDGPTVLGVQAIVAVERLADLVRCVEFGRLGPRHEPDRVILAGKRAAEGSDHEFRSVWFALFMIGVD
jgi:diguanylate cyclase (GGDEF)-like protein